LLYSLTSNEHDEDNRTNNQLAADLGLSEATLMSLSNIDPQKTSLRVFNALFPTNQGKEELHNVPHLTSEYPNLLKDILSKLCCTQFFSCKRGGEKDIIT
jgi:hypothetical protein